jgi:hypothetical protein
MYEGIKIPARVDSGFDRIAPAHDKFGQEDGHEGQIVNDKVAVYRLVEVVYGRGDGAETALDYVKTVNGIENDKGQIYDQKAQHGKVYNEPDELMALSQVVCIDV